MTRAYEYLGPCHSSWPSVRHTVWCGWKHEVTKRPLEAIQGLPKGADSGVKQRDAGDLEKNVGHKEAARAGPSKHR